MIERVVGDAIAAGVFPAAQVAVALDGDPVHIAAHGGHGGLVTGPDTLFDVSSLTKVVATTTLAYHLLSRGELALDAPVARWFPRASVGPATVRDLLAHTSGLPAWRPLFAEVDHAFGGAPDHGSNPGAQEARRQQVIAAAAATPLERPIGQSAVYSDVGFILLGAIVERVLGRRLDAAFAALVAEPLGLAHTAFRPAGVPSSGAASVAFGVLPIAPTGTDRPRPPAAGQPAFPPWRRDEPPGEVDDDNAWAMGGVAGHGGLFSTATDVARWGMALLDELDGAGRLGDPAVLQKLLRPVPGLSPPRALGFDRPAPTGSSAGSILGSQGPLGAVGHLGFTGCSVWLDLDRRWVVALLTNRTYPSRGNDSIRAFRPAFHDTVAAALERKT